MRLLLRVLFREAAEERSLTEMYQSHSGCRFARVVASLAFGMRIALG